MTRPQRVVRVPLYVLLVGIAMVVVSPILAVVVSTKIAASSQAEGDRKWCSVVVTLDDAYREAPPQTPVGRNVAEGLAELRRDIGCR